MLSFGVTAVIETFQTFEIAAVLLGILVPLAEIPYGHIRNGPACEGDLIRSFETVVREDR